MVGWCSPIKAARVRYSLAKCEESSRSETSNQESQTKLIVDTVYQRIQPVYIYIYLQYGFVFAKQEK